MRKPSMPYASQKPAAAKVATIATRRDPADPARRALPPSGPRPSLPHRPRRASPAWPARRAHQQRERMQQVEEAAGVDGPRDLVDVERYARGTGCRRQRRTAAPGTAPPMNSAQSQTLRQRGSVSLLRNMKPTGPQDQRDQHQEHCQVEARKRRGIEQRPGREHRAAAEDEPHLVALPDRLDGLEQSAALSASVLPMKRKSAPTPRSKPSVTAKPISSTPEQQPPDQTQRLVLEHWPSSFAGRRTGARRPVTEAVGAAADHPLHQEHVHDQERRVEQHEAGKRQPHAGRPTPPTHRGKSAARPRSPRAGVRIRRRSSPAPPRSTAAAATRTRASGPSGWRSSAASRTARRRTRTAR